MTPKIINYSSQLANILTPCHQIITQIEEVKTITIKQTRALIQKLNLTSDPTTIATYIIHAAHNLTLPAANNLLKALEESRSNQQIILITEKPHRLLPTILSRCQIIKQPKIRTKSQSTPFPNNLSPGQIPTLTDQILKEANPTNYLTSILYAYKPPHPAIKHIHQALIDLESNLNPRLVLDHLLLSLYV